MPMARAYNEILNVMANYLLGGHNILLLQSKLNQWFEMLLR